MKRTPSLPLFPALIAAILTLLIPGCDPSPPYGDDDPAQGSMSRETADRIFSWGDAKGGVEILKFRSVEALNAYLEGSRQAGAPSSLVLNRINGKNLVRIAERAFSPAKGGGGDDITTVVKTVKLPETIESLGASLFAGTANPVTVSIPPAVAERIPQKDLVSAAGGRATIQKVDPAQPNTPVVIVKGPSGGSGGGGSSGGSSSKPDTGSSGETGGTGEEGSVPVYLPPGLEKAEVRYPPEGGVQAVFTFDMAVNIPNPDEQRYTIEGMGGKEITLTPKNTVPGESLEVSLTAANPQDPSKTRTVSQRLMPVSGPFTRPGSALAYRVGYSDTHGAVGIKALSEGLLAGETEWYYVGEEEIRAIFNAVYLPNVPDAPVDTLESGKRAIEYTPAISSAVLALFRITLGPASGGDKIEITGQNLPGPAAVSDGMKKYYPLVIDLGLPGEDNRGLPDFSIPAEGLGTSGDDYVHIRLRVNRGAALVIHEGNPGGENRDYGNLARSTLEVMGGGELRDGRYEGFLGEGAVVIARLGSSLSVGPGSSFAGFSGRLIGPASDSGAAIRWGTGDQNGSFLEIREGKLAFNANIALWRNLTLHHHVWFVSAAFTIESTGRLSAGEGRYRFYGTYSSSGGQNPANPASEIKILPGGSLSRSFVFAGGGADDFVTATGSNLTITNKGEGNSNPPQKKVNYLTDSEEIFGYFNWAEVK